MIKYQIEEKDPQFPGDGWSVFGDFDSYSEARVYLAKLRADWPASQWRLIKITGEIIDD